MAGAAIVGAAVGLAFAWLLGTALAVVPRRPVRPRSGPPGFEDPEPPQRIAEPEPPTPAAGPRADPVVAPRERHRALYEAEFSWQERRLDALRQRIGTQLATAPRSAAPPAPGPSPGGGLENPPKAR